MLHRLVTGLLCSVCLLLGQSITGSIVGSVEDPAGLVVAGATVQVVSAATGAARQATTNALGQFVVGSLQPGAYDVLVRADGFKTAERHGVMLTASERLSMGAVKLEVGSVTESVTVEAQGAAVQTASSERAGVITSAQVGDLLIRGRNVTSLLSLLPGVVDRNDPDRLQRSWNISALGSRNSANNVWLDGMSLNASNNVNSVVGVSIDSVAEVKVLLSNYQAEYGRMVGANIQLVTKSGTREFHGLGSYFKRHEQFNAANFFNNRLGQPKPRYRFNTWTYNVGGPIYVPGKFNRNREKLFFFFSQEYWPLRTSSGLRQLTVPTGLERAGDFSQSLELNGRLIAISDPLARQPFPGNRVPASRIDPNGQALLRLFPQPNFFDRSISAGRYNYVFETEVETPQRTETLKIDYNLHPKHLLFASFTNYSDNSRGSLGVPAYQPNWPAFQKRFSTPGKVIVARHQWIVSPAAVNELNVGFSRRPEFDLVEEDELSRFRRDQAGFRTGQFNPSANPLQLIPNASFGGVQSPASLTFEGRFPIDGTLDMLSISDSFSRTAGTHTFKAGFYYDHAYRGTGVGTTFNGALNFGRNANNPLDAGYAYANAVLGVFNSYSEASQRPWVEFRARNIEWFAQDNWRVHRKLTLDYGVRFSYFPAVSERDRRLATFDGRRFDPARQPQLIQPAMVGGRRSGVHPVTGAVYPAALIGAIASGTGDATNGVVTGEPLYGSSGVLLGPRFGFAYDPFGKGRTAIRGGFGITNQNGESAPQDYARQAPLVTTPIINYGTLPGLLSSSGLLFPEDADGYDRNLKLPYVMNFSLSVQQHVGFGTVADVGYVGSLGRHLFWVRNLNEIPLGANFEPANADPTNPRVPLPPAFLRPLRGYNAINITEGASSSNYHSLQANVSRRFARGLQFGAAWTWSKSLAYNDGDNQGITSLAPLRYWHYGPTAYDRTHMLKVNWVWEVPQAPVSRRVLRQVVNGWQVSGIASFLSGAPAGVDFSTTTAADLTGGGLSPRIVVTGDPVLPKSKRTFERNFRTEVFQLPERGTLGNAAETIMRGPGVNNWDISVFKNFPIRERMRFQFRWEMYNAFNHTQFSAWDTSARFDPQGQQVNARFGEARAARNPRQMQLALRFYF